VQRKPSAPVAHGSDLDWDPLGGVGLPRATTQQNNQYHQNTVDRAALKSLLESAPSSVGSAASLREQLQAGSPQPQFRMHPMGNPPMQHSASTDHQRSGFHF
jgi:hypothetical protein